MSSRVLRLLLCSDNIMLDEVQIHSAFELWMSNRLLGDVRRRGFLRSVAKNGLHDTRTSKLETDPSREILSKFFSLNVERIGEHFNYGLLSRRRFSIWSNNPNEDGTPVESHRDSIFGKSQLILYGPDNWTLHPGRSGSMTRLADVHLHPQFPALRFDSMAVSQIDSIRSTDAKLDTPLLNALMRKCAGRPLPPRLAPWTVREGSTWL